MEITEITDEYMLEMRKNFKPYTLMILHKTSKFSEPGTDKIVWEHGRRNYLFRKKGKFRIICPIRDDKDIAGIMVLSTDLEESKKILDEDPGVKAGIFRYELYATFSFPGDNL